MLPVESQRREVAQEIGSAERRLKLAEEKHTSALANWKARLRARWAAGRRQPDEPRDDGRPVRTAGRARSPDRKPPRRHAASPTRVRCRFATHRRLAEETRLCDAKRPRRSSSSIICVPSTRSTCSASSNANRSASGPRRCESKRSSTPTRRSAIAAAATRCFRNAASPTSRNCANWPPSCDEAEELRKKRAATTREIAAAIGKHGTEADFAPFLADDQIGRLEHDWESLSTQFEELDRGLKERCSAAARWSSSSVPPAADQSLATKQVELDIVEQQIKKAIDAWRERAAVSMFLERIRDEYEQHRQPETLREASKYMAN